MTEANAVPDFAGKVVVFYLANPSRAVEAGVAIEYVEPRVLGDRLFLSGRIPEQVGQEWVSQLQTVVAWDAVVNYIVFDSREEFQRRMGQVKRGLLDRVLGRAG